ncbi:enterobactin synthase subunit F [Pilimelia anulata]|uniref:Enterobactin synthase subunit F n=1 Tax=Pilimelia anulata TaxID=53371 RepID=A0A8J3B8Y5_9ACTN|nr:non-ribosomal peptide synthetase [Pilimelia anulata]GGK04114.1 enterobactin synthase subunit F [Pilimelia anulata]
MSAPLPALPLTTAQQAIAYAQQLDPANPAYLCAHAITVRGRVDRAALAAAITAVTDAVPHLHVAVDGDRQVPHPPAPLAVHDLRGGPDPAAAAAAWMRADHTAAVPLGEPGLLRQALLVVADDEVVWYLRAHHLLLDGYGFTMITERVAAAYAGRAVPDAAPLAALLAEEAGYAAGDRCAADGAYWRDRLGPEHDAASPGAAVHPPGVPHRYHAPLDPGVADELDDLGRAAGASRVEVVFAAVALYVARVTGRADVALGLPLMNRLGSVAARVPGTVVNVLPLRVDVDHAGTVGDLVGRVGGALRAARRHGRYRYEQLQRDLGLVGGGRRLCGPTVNIKPYAEPPRFGDCAVTVTPLATGPIDDLEFQLWTDAAGSHLAGYANPAGYDAAATRAHRDRLAHLLAQLAAGTPATRLAALDIALPAEQSMPAGDTPPVAARTLVALIDAAPARSAVRAADGRLDPAELDARANRLARWLIDRGAGPDTLVAVALPRRADLVVALLAVLRAGAAYLPLDLDQPPARTAALLADARPVCVLTHRDVAPAPAGPPVAALDELDLSGYPAGPVADADRARPLTGADTAYVIYTSGSTGAPKGVAVPHAAIVNRLAWMQDHLRLTAADRVLQKTPYTFDVSVWEFFWPLAVGATLVLAAPGGHRDPAYLAGLVRDERITALHFVPSMLRAYLAGADVAAAALRFAVCSGEELPADLVAAWRRRVGVPLHNLYGPTEAAVDVTAHACGPADESGPVPIGRPVHHTRTLVLDPALRPCPPGVPGELYLAGVQLARGYLGRPALTAARFVADPYGPPGTRLYRTGDLARRRADGALEFLGRTDSQVKVRGFRIEPGEIEAALCAQPGVAAAAVTPWPGSPDRLVGYVVPRPGADPDPAALAAALADTLPAHLVPAAIVPLPALPLGSTGKLNRSGLPAPAAAAAPRRPPAGPTEELLCALTAAALDVPAVGPDDNFFDAGGHSLRAVALLDAVAAATGVRLPLAAVFAGPTPAQLAAAVVDAGDPADGLDSLLVLRRGEPGVPPLVCVHPAGGLAWCYAGLLGALPRHIPVYGLQAPGVRDPGAPPPDSIDAVAAEYVATLRAAGVTGPYRLVGWSVGGVIAQAMAVALRRAGEPVGLLALLDAYPGEQWRHLPPPDGAEALRALLYLAGVAESDVAGPLTAAAVLAVLRERGSPLADLGDGPLRAIADTVVRNARLLRAHHAAVYDGDAVFVAATAPRLETWLDPAAWRPHVAGKLDRHDLPCRHPDLMTPDRLAQIAAILAPHLGPAPDDGAGHRPAAPREPAASREPVVGRDPL